MKMSKLCIVYASLCAIIAVVACSGESESANDLGAATTRASSGSEASGSEASGSEASGTELSGTSVIDKALDGGATTSDAAP
jgi:hypothetical protein